MGVGVDASSSSSVLGIGRNERIGSDEGVPMVVIQIARRDGEVDLRCDGEGAVPVMNRSSDQSPTSLPWRLRRSSCFFFSGPIDNHDVSPLLWQFRSTIEIDIGEGQKDVWV
ncbi:unnamed protein product [Lactuca saligna]|uniref:Uncharacterized protein n=1 Tax=Lactuca saligna TaxID=75948 RepID=A0AA35YSM8_LACSI|nr:unnamed protein product [Lactuca saligna]